MMVLKKETTDMHLKKWFDKGMTTQEYIESMQVNQESLLSIFHGYQLSQEAKQVTQASVGKGIKAVVLTADWCGDAMVNIPVFLKLTQNSLMECRFLIRDENLELMDQYLTNGRARSIPIILFMDENGEELAKWGPRAQEIEEVVSSYKTSLPEKDAPTYEKEFKETFLPKMHQLFKEKSTWAAVEKDLLTVFKTFPSL